MIDPHRSTGRTTRLALFYALEACNRPGEPIEVSDHFNSSQEHLWLARSVGKLLDAMCVPHTIVDRQVTVEVKRESHH